MRPDMPFRADVRQKPERLAVAAEEDVLPVVHPLPGLAILKRRRPPTEAAARFEHDDAATGTGESHGGAQTGEPRADDQRVGVAHEDSSHWRRAINACTGFGTRVLPEKTS